MIIHGHVQAIPSDALVAVHIPESAGDPMPETGNSSEVLCVEVEQITWSRMLIALNRGRARDPSAPRQSRAAHNARRGRRADADGSRDLGTRPPLPPQNLDAERDRGRGLARARTGTA